MTTQQVILLGGGGHAAVVADAARSSGWTVRGCLDDDPNTGCSDLPRLGAVDQLDEVLRSLRGAATVHAAVGDNRLRARWLSQADAHDQQPVIHASAIISPSATIGRGVFVGPRAVINARAIIGDGVILNTGAIVEHDCRVGDHAHIAPGAILAGTARVGGAALIGCAAVVLPGVNVEQDATLGAGAVATCDVLRGTVAAGVPARALTADN